MELGVKGLEWDNKPLGQDEPLFCEWHWTVEYLCDRDKIFGTVLGLHIRIVKQKRKKWDQRRK